MYLKKDILTNFRKIYASLWKAVRKLFENHLRKHKLNLTSYLEGIDDTTLARYWFYNQYKFNLFSHNN